MNSNDNEEDRSRNLWTLNLINIIETGRVRIDLINSTCSGVAGHLTDLNKSPKSKQIDAIN